MQRSSAPPGRGRSLAGAMTLAVVLAACGSGTETTATTGTPLSSTVAGAGQPGNGATPSSATPPTLPGAPPTLPGGTATSAGGTAATKAPTDPNAPRLNADVLQGQATAIDGTTFDLGSLAGKDLVVWFWAPW